MFFRKKGTGWLPDSSDARDYDFRMSAPAEYEKVSPKTLENYFTAKRNPYDQGRGNSCVAEALSAAVAIRKATSRPIAAPLHILSRYFIYWSSRMLHNGEEKDRGTYIRLAVNAMRKYGAPLEKFWPHTYSKINKKPIWPAWGNAYPHRFGTYYRITGANIPGQVRRAINQNMPVVFGMQIDNDFFKRKGPPSIGIPQGKLIGGHAMVIVGWKKLESKNVYRVLNSWGAKWRDNGLTWFDEELLTWKKLRDLTVIED